MLNYKIEHNRRTIFVRDFEPWSRLTNSEESLKSSWRLGGFTQKQIEIHKSEYLSIYGHQNLRHLIRLEEIGLIQVQNEKSNRQVKDTMMDRKKGFEVLLVLK